MPQHNGTNNGNTTQQIDFASVITIGLPLLVVVVMTILGNILVLLAVALNRNLRTTTNYFIVNLATADLLLGISVLPFSAMVEMLNDHWLLGAYFCDIWLSMDVLCCTASILSLCCISIDRYIGVTRPLRHASVMTHRRVCYALALIWLLATAVSVVPFFGWRHHSGDKVHCEVNDQMEYVMFSATVSFYLPASEPNWFRMDPALTILILYTRIYIEVVQRSELIKRGQRRSKSESTETTIRINIPRNDRSQASSPSTTDLRPTPSLRRGVSSKTLKLNIQVKAAKTLGLVVGIFMLCWTPFFVALPIQSLCQCIPGLLFKIIFWLGYCNSMMNPAIYAYSSREFRNAFRKILCACCERRYSKLSLLTNADLEALKSALPQGIYNRRRYQRNSRHEMLGGFSSGTFDSPERLRASAVKQQRSKSICVGMALPLDSSRSSNHASPSILRRRPPHQLSIFYEAPESDNSDVSSVYGPTSGWRRNAGKKVVMVIDSPPRDTTSIVTVSDDTEYPSDSWV